MTSSPEQSPTPTDRATRRRWAAPVLHRLDAGRTTVTCGGGSDGEMGATICTCACLS